MESRKPKGNGSFVWSLASTLQATVAAKRVVVAARAAGVFQPAAERAVPAAGAPVPRGDARGGQPRQAGRGEAAAAAAGGAAPAGQGGRKRPRNGKAGQQNSRRRSRHDEGLRNVVPPAAPAAARAGLGAAGALAAVDGAGPAPPLPAPDHPEVAEPLAEAADETALMPIVELLLDVAAWSGVPATEVRSANGALRKHCACTQVGLLATLRRPH